jgi:ABC-type transport system substrate-binding protein
MKGFYVAATLVALALTLSPFVLLDRQEEDEYAGKVVRSDVYGSAVKSLDPATCGDTTSSGFQGNVYEGLCTYHFLKRPVEVIPQLAAAMPEVSEDGLTYTVRIKKGVLYHRNPCFGEDPDGGWSTRTVKADDFVLAFKRIADYHINTGLAWAFTSDLTGMKDYREETRKYSAGDFSRYDLPIEGVRALDEHTVQFHLDKPYPQFIYFLSMHVGAPIPREAIDYWLGTEDDGKGGRKPIPLAKRTTEFREAEQVVGTGPYRFKTFVRKSKIVLVRNEDFRDDFYPSEGEEGDKEAGLLDDAGKKVPFIDVLKYDFVAESYSAWMLFLSRQRDAGGIPKDVFENVIKPDQSLANQWRGRGIQLKTYRQPLVFWIVFNQEDPIIGASKALRQALCACFDVESYIKVQYNNRGKRPVNILPSSFKGWKEAGPGPYFRYDLELAKRKIQEAKEELGALGLLEDGEIPQLRVDLGGTDQRSIQMGEFFQQQFAQIGVDLRVIPNDWPRLQQKVNNKQCQMYTMGWHADCPDAQNFLQLYYSPNIARQTNDSNFSNPEFDEIYEQISVMNDSPERTALYARMVKILSEECPVLPLVEPEAYVLVYDWVKNVKPHPVGYGFTKYRRIDVQRRHEMGGKER